MWNQAMEVGDRLGGIARTDVVHVRHCVLVAVTLSIKDFVLISDNWRSWRQEHSVRF